MADYQSGTQRSSLTNYTSQLKLSVAPSIRECKKMCPAHDFKELEWRHLNFFQHHCYIRAKVPRTKCLEHGIRRILVPWARNGSSFTLLFEQAVLMREMPMLSVARQTGIEDKRVARIIKHYVEEGKKQIDLSNLKSIGLDGTSSKRGHNYVLG